MIEISYNKEEDFVYVRTTATYTPKDVDKFLSDSLTFAKEKQTSRVLYDHRGTKFEANILDIHNITKYLINRGFNIRLKGAVVYDQNEEKYKFADTVAHNWSKGVLRFFDDFQSAKDWLLGKD